MEPIRRLEAHDGGKGTPKITLSQVMDAHERLLFDAEKLASVKATHGLTPDAVNFFNLGLAKNGSTIVLPFLDGVRVAGFATSERPGDDFPAYTGQRATFNARSLQNRPERVFLCPSALDAVLVWQITGEAVVANSHRGSLTEDQLALLAEIPEVVLVFPESRASFELARQIGPKRTLIARIPGAMVSRCSTEEIEKAIMGAEPYRTPGLKSFQEGFAILREKVLFGEIEETFVDFGSPTMNELAGQISEGDVVLLMAKRKIGKTSAGLEISLHNALKDRASLLVELEMAEEPTLKRTIQMVANCTKDEIDADRIDEATNAIAQVPWYYWICGDLRGRDMFDEWLEKLRYAIRQHALRIVIFDHIHLLMRGCANMEADMAYISGRFKQMAVDEKIAMIILCQPKRTKDQTTFDDGKYSSALEQDADLILVLNREEMKTELPDPTTRVRRGIYHPLTRVSALGRNAAGGIGWLMFEENYFRFRELSDQEFKDLRP